MKKAFIIISILLLGGGGTGYYFYDKEQKRIAAEEAYHDSIRHARDLENARLAAIEKAHRDSLAAYEKTHAPVIIADAAERLINDGLLSGNKHCGGSNWTERMNELRQQCDDEIAHGPAGIDTIFRSFNFRGLMGRGVHVESDSIKQIYFISNDSAWVDVHFNTDKYPEGQNVTLKLHFIDSQWKLDDFVFLYNDGEAVSVANEMRWFIDFCKNGAKIKKEVPKDEKRPDNDKKSSASSEKRLNTFMSSTPNDKKSKDSKDKKSSASSNDKKSKDSKDKKSSASNDKKSKDSKDKKSSTSSNDKKSKDSKDKKSTASSNDKKSKDSKDKKSSASSNEKKSNTSKDKKPSASKDKKPNNSSSEKKSKSSDEKKKS